MEQGRQGAGDSEDLHPEASRAQGGQARGPAAGEEDRGRGGGGDPGAQEGSEHRQAWPTDREGQEQAAREHCGKTQTERWLLIIVSSILLK